MPHKYRKTLFARLRAHFLTGLLVTVPIAITIIFARWLIDIINQYTIDLFPDRIDLNRYMTEELGLPIGIPGLGILIMVVLFITIGALTKGLFGGWVIRMWERVLDRVPVLSSLYNLSKQIMETFLKQEKNAFQEAVLLEYPRKGLWVIAFITADSQPEISQPLRGGDSLVNVFVPTAPNPTSGFVIIVKRSELKSMDCTVEEAIKLVISGGIIGKDEQQKQSQENQK